MLLNPQTDSRQEEHKQNPPHKNGHDNEDDDDDDYEEEEDEEGDEDDQQEADEQQDVDYDEYYDENNEDEEEMEYLTTRSWPDDGDHYFYQRQLWTQEFDDVQLFHKSYTAPCLSYSEMEDSTISQQSQHLVSPPNTSKTSSQKGNQIIYRSVKQRIIQIIYRFQHQILTFLGLTNTSEYSAQEDFQRHYSHFNRCKAYQKTNQFIKWILVLLVLQFCSEIFIYQSFYFSEAVFSVMVETTTNHVNNNDILIASTATEDNNLRSSNPLSDDIPYNFQFIPQNNYDDDVENGENTTITHATTTTTTTTASLSSLVDFFCNNRTNETNNSSSEQNLQRSLLSISLNSFCVPPLRMLLHSLNHKIFVLIGLRVLLSLKQHLRKYLTIPTFLLALQVNICIIFVSLLSSVKEPTSMLLTLPIDIPSKQQLKCLSSYTEVSESIKSIAYKYILTFRVVIPLFIAYSCIESIPMSIVIVSLIINLEIIHQIYDQHPAVCILSCLLVLILVTIATVVRGIKLRNQYFNGQYLKLTEYHHKVAEFIRRSIVKTKQVELQQIISKNMSEIITKYIRKVDSKKKEREDNCRQLLFNYFKINPLHSKIEQQSE